MRHQLRILRHRLPVLLDPGLRAASVRAEAAWRLPQRAESRVLYTFGGTAAVYQAVKALALTAGDKVLIPAYNCGHEIEPVLRAGAGVAFYRVDGNMRIDLEHLEAAVDGQTRAVLVTHYFGFPQAISAIRELCDRHRLALIEDCAHALFSRDGEEPLGLAGDLAVFSLRKTLPLPHGGAVVCHDPRLAMPASLQRPPRLSTLPKLLERYQKAWLMPPAGSPTAGDRIAFVANRLLVDAIKCARGAAALAGRTQLDPDAESLGFPGEALDWGMDASAVKALGDADPEAIAAARRRNYGLLLAAADRLTDCRPVFPDLPAGVCPLYFPVFAEHAERLVRRLAGGAVASVQWWAGTFHSAVSWEQFPDAAFLKRSVVALPIHQDLGPAHMQRIVGLLAER
ncbi:MAG: aminotransferase class I/II-fold pyridoxal phosphate-dependent enzyme [Gammaproteobacteria bacterium]